MCTISITNTVILIVILTLLRILTVLFGIPLFPLCCYALACMENMAATLWAFFLVGGGGGGVRY